MMSVNYIRKKASFAILGSLICFSCGLEDPIDFSAEVKPILNKHCISCHGGVKQSGGFGLVTRDQAMEKTESGLAAIIPGHGTRSEMIKRLRSSDPELRMPFEADPLPAGDIEVLERWIDEGAHWNLHWSYRPLNEIKPPQILLGGTMQPEEPHPIDLFVLDKLKAFGISTLSPQADPGTLLRRVSLDLIGMPAPQAIQDEYLKAKDLDRLIDQLLNLPQFGEKWASMWLDIARYADSKGYERDPHRNIWRYRDWVIRAFNQDKPYDEFIIEQLAGDMLPDPTDDQLIATGFHRNTSTNDEGGTDNEEYRNHALFDRVNTTWEGLLGTTMACVQCHSHPYDPITHSEFYESMAIFNNSRDADTHMDYPLLRIFDETDRLKMQELADWMGQVLQDSNVQEIERFIKTWQPAWHGIETDSFINSALYDMKYLGLRQNGSARLKQIDLTDKKNIYVRYRTNRNDGTWSIYVDRLGGPKLLSETVPNTQGKWKIHRFDIPEMTGRHDLFLHYYSKDLPKGNDRPQLSFDWLRFDDIELPWSEAGGEMAKDQFWDLLEAKASTTLVMIENPHDMRRETRRFDRGNFLVPEEIVKSGIPQIFGNWPDDLATNRLGFAKWIVDSDNPLAARTWVNRIWAQLFGRGIVETLEDLGSQGATPTHPQLLDWMAWQMMHEHKWSLKRFLKEVMLSKTYQQQSVASEHMLVKDPNNLFLARGPRVRLTAEQIRDQALWVSGLMNQEMFGPSVMPYQPVQWNVPYSNEQWKMSKDGQQYRRAVYTYWKRSSPYPAMMIFDAAERSVCSARRIHTNTPLHALVTLNDPVFVEAAAHLGKYMWHAGQNFKERIGAGYRKSFGMEISDAETSVYEDFFKAAKTAFDDGGSDAEQLLAYLDADVNSDLAGMVMVANALMNTDAFIMKN